MLVHDEVVGLESKEQATPRPAPTGLEGEGTLQDAVRGLITTYHSLNPSSIITLTELPSALEFMRHVALNQPFVLRGGASSWKAVQQWNASYLNSLLATQAVNAALTPNGNADSIITTPSGSTLFVKPLETQLLFPTALSLIQKQELHSEEGDWDGATCYLQTQNDNLRDEYAALFADVPPSIPFARIALGREPDAVNFWLGNSYSTTALHKDNYENVYVQIRGQKHFVLLPPVEAPCVGEKGVLAATYALRNQDTDARDEERGMEIKAGVKKDDLIVSIDAPREYVPFATWDPDLPTENATPYSKYSSPLRVTLDEGDMLYLPALWYHKVSQSCNEEGICCAVNYWYDMEFAGGFWSMAGFVRSVGLLSNGAAADEKNGEESNME